MSTRDTLTPEKAEWHDTPEAASYLERLLEEVEQALVARLEPPPRPRPVTALRPRPFAYD